MNIEKMREEFEAFACARTGGTAEEIAAERREDSYRDDDLATGWFVWQGSRESLVIELPEHYQYDSPGEVIQVLKDCRAAIEAAGLKVKP